MDLHELFVGPWEQLRQAKSFRVALTGTVRDQLTVHSKKPATYPKILCVVSKMETQIESYKGKCATSGVNRDGLFLLLHEYA